MADDIEARVAEVMCAARHPDVQPRAITSGDMDPRNRVPACYECQRCAAELAEAGLLALDGLTRQGIETYVEALHAARAELEQVKAERDWNEWACIQNQRLFAEQMRRAEQAEASALIAFSEIEAAEAERDRWKRKARKNDRARKRYADLTKRVRGLADFRDRIGDGGVSIRDLRAALRGDGEATT